MNRYTDLGATPLVRRFRLGGREPRAGRPRRARAVRGAMCDRRRPALGVRHDRSAVVPVRANPRADRRSRRDRVADRVARRHPPEPRLSHRADRAGLHDPRRSLGLPLRSTTRGGRRAFGAADARDGLVGVGAQEPAPGPHERGALQSPRAASPSPDPAAASPAPRLPVSRRGLVRRLAHRSSSGAVTRSQRARSGATSVIDRSSPGSVAGGCVVRPGARRINGTRRSYG